MKTRTECPICGHGVWRMLCRSGLDLEGERVRFCVRCGGVFLSPHMDESDAAAYYRREYSRRYRGAERPDRAATARRDGIAQERFRGLASRFRREGLYLEIGCGAGSFLARLAAAGHRAAGVEAAEGYAAAGRERGLAIETGTFPRCSGPAPRYDGILLFHVLEHVPEPADLLRAIRDRLAPGGFVAIEVPDVLVALDGKFRHRYFQRPHLIDFHRASLEHLLARTGLAVESAMYGPAGRAHHLLVVARAGTVPPSWHPPDQVRTWWRRLRRRIVLSRTLAPLSNLGSRPCLGTTS
ncbi:MAG: class I SAM-dependent methyltransferase [Planctomycetes bacterium]|nr:class I SAM-dependent methyltransferase [Planctomycetota bacterium]